VEYVIGILIALYFVVLLGAGTASIMIASYLYRKFQLQYLRSYLYYQILIVIFGIYGLLGTILAQTILENLESAPQMVVTVGHLIPFLGVPFLVAGLYMFLKMCWEIVDKSLTRKFTFGYYAFLLLFFLGYGIVILRIPQLKADQYDNVTRLIMFAFVGLEVIILLLAVVQLYTRSGSIKDPIRKQTILNFTHIMFGIHVVGIVLLIFSDFNRIAGAIYLFIYFASDILPLLYIGSYLNKHHKQEEYSELKGIEIFNKKHEITRRESEIIELINQGKTNKEIADMLFITLQTVKDHTHRIYTKTGVRNRVELINLLRKLEE